MARVTGARAADYEEKRAELIVRVRNRLARTDATHPSFRELAQSAGVSQTTLRHYFGTLDALIVAVFEAHAEDGAPYLAFMATPTRPFSRSVAEATEFMAIGQKLPINRGIHAIGRSEGLRRSTAGVAYRHHILDAILAAIAARFEKHMRDGEMRCTDPRCAAIQFAAPILFAFEHQNDFGGAAGAPIDIERFLVDHINAFIAAFQIN